MYDRRHETMSREELGQLQIERLQMTLNRVNRNVAFYRDLFNRQGVDIGRIRSLSDLQSLPFTTREDLRTAYPYGMFAVPLRDIIRIHATSGTTGKPIVVGYTKNDVVRWSELIARQLTSIGIDEHDVIQIAFDYSLFTGGLGYHYGAELIGASVIPASSGRNVREQISIMKDFKATALITTPTHALSIASALETMGLHPGELFTKCGVFGAEPWSESVRSRLERSLHIRAYDTYGLSEIIGPGVAAECTERSGLHINEDHFIPEIIDPRTLSPCRPGEEGELVFTTVTKEGFPLIRYRTGDRAALIEGPCACGRTLVRMSRIHGRTDDMVIVGGVKFFPSQVESAILSIDGVDARHRIVIDKTGDTDTMELQVGVSEAVSGFDEIKSLERLRSRIVSSIEESVGILPKVTFVEAATIETPAGRKKCTVVENRQQ